MRLSECLALDLGLGRRVGVGVEVLHHDRLLAMLDSPLGYGVRAASLGIPMSLDEQISFWEFVKGDIVTAVQRQGELVADVSRQMSGYIDERLQKLERIRDCVAFGAASLRGVVEVVGQGGVPRLDLGRVSERILSQLQRVRQVCGRLVHGERLEELELEVFESTMESIERLLQSLIEQYPPGEDQLGRKIDEAVVQLGESLKQADDPEAVDLSAFVDQMVEACGDGLRPAKKLKLLMYVVDNIDELISKSEGAQSPYGESS